MKKNIYKDSEIVRLIPNASEVSNNDFAIMSAIYRGDSWIFKNTLRGGGHFIISEGTDANDFFKRNAHNNVLNHKFPIVSIPGGVFENCITLIRRGDYTKLIVKPDKNKSGALVIPELELVVTKTRQKDYVYTIFLEKSK